MIRTIQLLVTGGANVKTASSGFCPRYLAWRFSGEWEGNVLKLAYPAKTSSADRLRVVKILERATVKIPHVQDFRARGKPC